MAYKKKTLPKNFGELIKENNIENLKKVFDTCELDARGGYGKTTALSFYKVPEELIRWLVGNGADIEAVDDYGRAALHEQSNDIIIVLLELGGNVNALDIYDNTPLHLAASSFKIEAVKKLLEFGANTKALNKDRQTPLEKALFRAENSNITNLLEISNILLNSKSEITQKMKDAIRRIGENFEFHREQFNKLYLNDTDNALTKLYEIYDVSPVKKRLMHDGVSPIIVNSATWRKQFEELWELLIPSSGSAKTVQGEVVRIAGRVEDEISRNGGGNWDSNYKKMLDAYLIYLSSNNSLPDDELRKLGLIVKDIRENGYGENYGLKYLCEAATKWVLANSTSIMLEKPNYNR